MGSAEAMAVTPFPMLVPHEHTDFPSPPVSEIDHRHMQTSVP